MMPSSPIAPGATTISHSPENSSRSALTMSSRIVDAISRLRVDLRLYTLFAFSLTSSMSPTM